MWILIQKTNSESMSIYN